MGDALMQIAVVGSNEFVTGFQLAGVKDVYITDETNMENSIEKALTNESIGVMVLEGTEYANVSERMKNKLTKLVKPVQVVISTQAQEGDIRSLIKRSIGVDLLKE